MSPVSADEETRGWIDRILDLFDRPDNEAADVPDRGTPAETSRAVTPTGAPEGPEAAQRPPARASVEFPERRPGMTPSNAFQAAQDIVAEIDILREELGANDYPPEAELMGHRNPIHVYAKSLEVLEKVVAAQQRMGDRSKCGNSSLHTRAGLSRGTQCSGSGVSNDARARQRPSD